jgi:hypothetical protein
MTDVIDVTEEQQSVTALLSYLRDLRSEKERIESRIRDINFQLTEIIKDRTDYVDPEGNRYTASVIRKEDLVVDLDRLRELNEDLHVRATKRVLDVQAFKHLLETGEINQDIAVEVARTRQSSPYVQFYPQALEFTNE